MCQNGGDSVMACICMAANTPWSLVFIDDGTADRSSKMNAEVYRAILCSHSAEFFKLIGWYFTVWMDSDPNYTAKASHYLKAKKWK